MYLCGSILTFNNCIPQLKHTVKLSILYTFCSFKCSQYDLDLARQNHDYLLGLGVDGGTRNQKDKSVGINSGGTFCPCDKYFAQQKKLSLLFSRL